MENIVEMKNITKKFGDFTANDGINLNIKKGEIHAILGENGAGKTTLMNMLYGLIKPTSGEIYVKGKKTALNGPNDAISLGIGMVHQHFMLIKPFTICENIVLGKEPEIGFLLDMDTAKRRVVKISEQYGLIIDPNAKIEDISVGMQQRVEILKVLYRGCDILILDEPTASLTPQEIIELSQIMKSLTEKGKTIIIITHKLKEIIDMSDRVSIICRGKLIDVKNTSETNEQDLANCMVGREVIFKTDKMPLYIGEPVLQIQNLWAKDYRDTNIIKGLNLTVHAGEIVGIAGIDGNGQTELAEILQGLRESTKGKITICGNDVTNKSPKEIFESGISQIPEDRQKHGLILEYSVAENLILQNYKKEPYSKNGMLNEKAIISHAQKLIKKYDIRPDDSELKSVDTLSGGNQQKVIIAREVENDKPLLIAVNPTRGLDVGAIEYVHNYLVAQRDKGACVLLISFELDEIMDLSDRIDVIYEGKIVKSFKENEADEFTIGLLMAGGKQNEQ